MAQKPVWIVDCDQKTGFTLIEMIIIIIVLSVLASLALPRFYDTVEFSRSMEALKNIDLVRTSMDTCFALTADYSECADFDTLDAGDPSNYVNSHFEYVFDSADTEGFSITALRNTLDGGDGVSTIVFTYDATSITKSGTGAFEGIK